MTALRPGQSPPLVKMPMRGAFEWDMHAASIKSLDGTSVVEGQQHSTAAFDRNRKHLIALQP